MSRNERVANQQATFAANLGGTSLGMALFDPIEFRENMLYGRVGDVAYFDSEGSYKWICNAFDTDVVSLIY